MSRPEGDLSGDAAVMRCRSAPVRRMELCSRTVESFKRPEKSSDVSIDSGQKCVIHP
jgi:hypothetical protein